MNFVRGLDPLGLQNTTEATYTLLLPGLNNVSRKIRYYAFYCWLLDAYGRSDGSLDPGDQHRYIRRGELLVALVNQCLDTPSGEIPGTDYAANWLRDGTADFDLEKGTYLPGGVTEGTYWKNPNGAFGQYYLGSMRDIGLIVERPGSRGLYARSPVSAGQVSGEELAAAFAANLPAADAEIFLTAVRTGRISRSRLEGLTGGFNFSKPPAGSLEAQLLRQVLVQPDEPAQGALSPVFRRRTIHYLLDLAADGPAQIGRAFTLQAYREKGRIPRGAEAALTGWYYYQLNEFWQFTCLAVLDAVLDRLDDLSPVSWYVLDDLVELLVEETTARLGTHFGIDAGDTVGGAIELLPGDEESELLKQVRQQSRADCIAAGLVLILRLKAGNQTCLEQLAQFAGRHQVSRDGDAVTFLLKMERFYRLPLRDWIRDFLFTHILYRHQFVAFRKLGGGNLSTQLFLLEEGRIRLNNHFPPAATSPRLDTLIGFFEDLDLLAKGQLTPAGRLLGEELADD
jgi:hypothetical protein